MADEETKRVVTEDQKPSTEDTITLKVFNADGATTTFKIKRSTKLRKLMDTYCSRMGLDINSVRFLYEGQRLATGTDDTPDDLNMEDDDQIDVMIEQTGGSF